MEIRWHGYLQWCTKSVPKSEWPKSDLFLSHSVRLDISNGIIIVKTDIDLHAIESTPIYRFRVFSSKKIVGERMSSAKYLRPDERVLSRDFDQFDLARVLYRWPRFDDRFKANLPFKSLGGFIELLNIYLPGTIGPQAYNI